MIPVWGGIPWQPSYWLCFKDPGRAFYFAYLTTSRYTTNAPLPMQKTYNVYHNLDYWFLLPIILVVAGFYKTYFISFFDGHRPIIHIHFVLVALWIVMLILQPFLIKLKKLSLHRPWERLVKCLFLLYCYPPSWCSASLTTGSLLPDMRRYPTEWMTWLTQKYYSLQRMHRRSWYFILFGLHSFICYRLLTGANRLFMHDIWWQQHWHYQVQQ